MKGTVELLDEIKGRYGIASDYGLAKYLGFDESRINHYRAGRRYLSDETALQIAKLLDMPAGQVLAMIQAERATNAAVKKAWESLAKKAAGVTAAALLLTWSIGALVQPAFDITKIIDPSAPEYTLCAIVIWLVLCTWSAVSLSHRQQKQQPQDRAPAPSIR